MLHNYLLITFRNLLKNKLYVIVNILGIGIAIASCIVAYYNVRFHYDFDNQHSKKNQIYKIGLTKEINKRQQPYAITPIILGPSIGNSIPGVEEVVRYSNSNQAIRYGEHIFNKRIGYTDENFFKVFDFTFLFGDQNSLKVKNSIMINQSLAKICFADDNPIGKLITVYNTGGKE